ncbi:hypothetical protein D3C75_866950 [compost metagenome]
MLQRIGLAAQHHRGRAAGRWTSHQASQDARPHHLVGHHLFSGDYFAEHGLRVVGRVTAGLGANLGESFQRGAETLHVLHAGAAENTQGRRDLRGTGNRFVALIEEQLQRARAIREGAADGSGNHLLETEGQDDVHHAAGDGLVGQVQGRGTAGAVVVYVQYRDAGHADVVEHTLATGRVTENVAGECLLDRLVTDAGICQGQAHGLLAHDRIGLALTRFYEGDHAYTRNDDFLHHVLLLNSGNPAGSWAFSGLSGRTADFESQG